MAKKPKIAAPAADQPYYLQRAHIKDFRSIRDAVVEFKPGLNIIIGANGSGKTNFVRCVESGINPQATGFLGGNMSTFDLVGEELSHIEYHKQIENPLHGSLISFSQENYIKLNTILTNNKNIAQGNSLSDAFSRYKGQAYKDFSNLYISQTIMINHGTPNSYGIASIPLKLSISESGWGGFTDQVEFVPTSVKNSRVSIFISSFDSLKKKENNLAPILKNTQDKLSLWINYIKPYLKKFSPINDLKLSKSVQVYNNHLQNEVLIQGIILEFKINKDWLPFSSLSSGTQRMFYIISEVLSMTSLHFETYHANDLSEFDFKIILLEEPELGIHPDQLHLLLNFLREQSQKHQLIITTHSPQVLDMLNDDELDRITICELDKKKGTQFRKLKKTQIAAAKKYMSTQGLYLSDYWRYGSLENTH